MKCDPLSPRQKPCFPHRFDGWGASPLDAIYQRRSEQISAAHSGAFMESRSLVLGDSFMRCQRRPLTDPATRSFEMRTSPWRLIHAVPYLFHPPGCQNWHEHQSRPLQVVQATLSACEAPHVSVGNETSKIWQIPKTPIAWESCLRGKLSTSSNSCHQSTNMTISSHMDVQSASSQRPPWDSTIYRDPLAKAAPDKESVNCGECEVVKSPAHGNVHSGFLKGTESKNMECCDCQALRADKGVQCEQHLLPQRSPNKHSGWCASRQAWVPPGVHVVNAQQRIPHATVTRAQMHPRHKPNPLHFPKRSKSAQHDTVEHCKQASAVKGYKVAARVPLLPVKDSQQNGSTVVSPDIGANFSRAEEMGNHSLTGIPNALNACHAPARLRGASKKRVLVQKSRPIRTSMKSTERDMSYNSHPLETSQQWQTKSAGVSGREAAARKLLEQLELETADSLNELERLVEEQHRQLMDSGVHSLDAKMPWGSESGRLANGRSAPLQGGPHEGGSVRGAALSQMAAALEEAIII